MCVLGGNTGQDMSEKPHQDLGYWETCGASTQKRLQEPMLEHVLDMVAC